MLCCEEEIKLRVGITYGDFGTGAGTNHQLIFNFSHQLIFNFMIRFITCHSQ